MMFRRNSLPRPRAIQLAVELVFAEMRQAKNLTVSEAGTYLKYPAQIIAGIESGEEPAELGDFLYVTEAYGIDPVFWLRRILAKREELEAAKQLGKRV